MAFDAFMKIDGIPGESTDSKHKDWIEITSYNHSARQFVSKVVSSAGGATAERVDFGDLIIHKLIDKASPKLLEACCSGKHIKEITIELCRAGGDKQKYLEIKMSQVLISGYQHGAAGDRFGSETVTFNPGVFKMVYSQQKRADGVAGGNVSGGWDLTANKAVA